MNMKIGKVYLLRDDSDGKLYYGIYTKYKSEKGNTKYAYKFKLISEHDFLEESKKSLRGYREGEIIKEVKVGEYVLEMLE